MDTDDRHGGQRHPSRQQAGAAASALGGPARERAVPTAAGRRRAAAALTVAVATPALLLQVLGGQAVAGDGAARFTWQLEQLAAGRDGAVVERDLDHAAVPATSPVRLDGCGSTPAPAAATYTWTFSGGAPALRSTACAVTWDRPLTHAQTTVEVTLTVQPPAGSAVAVSHQIAFRDLVVASLGDSAASGEGAPEAPRSSSAFRVSTQCDRSGWAAGAQAALRVQRTLPDTTVHLWDISCAGASITSAGSAHPLDDGGLLDPFAGTHGTATHAPLVPQVERLRQLQAQTRSAGLPAGLPVDRLLLTAGANDTHWGSVASSCLYLGLAYVVALPLQAACVRAHTPAMRTALAGLPARFDRLAAALDPDLVPARQVYLSEYFDPIDSLRPQPALCRGELLAGPALRTWAAREVEGPLQSVMAGKARQFGWNLVGGVRQAFQGHGLCQPIGQRWVDDIGESLLAQRSTGGAWHPNRAGQLATAGLVVQRILPGLADAG